MLPSRYFIDLTQPEIAKQIKANLELDISGALTTRSFFSVIAS